MADSDEWIEHGRVLFAVEPDALRGKFRGECGRVGALFGPLANGLVGNEPRVATATLVAASGMPPARDIGLVLVWNADGQAVDAAFAFWREMKNVFVAIVDEARGVNRLEMPV